MAATRTATSPTVRSRVFRDQDGLVMSGTCFRENGGEAVGGLAEARLVEGEADAQPAFSVEHLTGDDSDVGLVEQAGGEVRGRGAFVGEEFADVGKREHPARGRGAVDAGHLAEL